MSNLTVPPLTKAPGLDDLLEKSAALVAPPVAQSGLTPSPSPTSLIPQQPAPSPAPAPQEPRGEDYLRELIREDKLNEDKLVMQSFEQAIKTNPDLAGEAQRLGVELGIDTEIVKRNIDKVRGILQQQHMQQVVSSRSDPYLVKQLANYEFAQIAHDDTANLSLWEQMVGAWKAGQLQTDLGFLGSRIREGGGNDADIAEAGKLQERIAKLPSGRGFLTGLAKTVGQLSHTVPEALAAGGVAGATLAGAAAIVGQLGPQAAFPEEIATIPLAFAKGAIWGTAAAMAAQSYRVEGGLSYITLRQGGVSHEVAGNASVVVGLVNSALDVVGFGAMTKVFRTELTRKLTHGVIESLAKPTFGAAGLKAAQGYLKGGLGELGAELTQEVTNIVSEEMVGLRAGPDDPTIIARLADIAAETAYGVALLGLPGPAFGFHGDMQRAARAKQTGEVFEAMRKAHEESKVKDRNPASYEKFVGGALQEGGGPSTTYVDAKVFDDVLRQNGITREDLAQSMPAVAEQLPEAMRLGEDVAIPTEQFLSKFEKTAVQEALIPHITFDRDDWSLAKSMEFEATQKERAKEAAELLEEREVVDELFVESANRLHADLIERVKSTGKFPVKGDAEAYATHLRDFFVVKAAKSGTTPEAFAAKYDLGIEAGKATGEAGAVQQVSVESPEFREWFGDSKVVDESGKPLVVYHGGADVQDFDTTRGGGGAAMFGPGTYFGGVGVAEEWASHRGGKVTAAYLSMSSPWDERTPGDGGQGIDVAKSHALIERLKAEGLNPRDLEGLDSPSPGDLAHIAGQISKLRGIPQWDAGAVLNAMLREAGFDGIIANFSAGGGGYQFVAFEPSQIIKNDPNILRQGPRGEFSPSRLKITLTGKTDSSTLAHELSHFFMHVTFDMARGKDATAEMVADAQVALDWFGVKDLAAWDALTFEQQAPHHEAFAYSWEKWLYEGKAPSVQMEGLFRKLAAFIRRAYKSVVTELNRVYRENFGVDLPALTPEVRALFGRMIASEEQIKQAQAVRGFAPAFQNQKQSGMDDVAWAAHLQSEQDAEDAAVALLTSKSLKDMALLDGAKGRVLKALQRKYKAERKAMHELVRGEVENERVYQAIAWLRKGEFTAPDGTPSKEEGQHKLHAGSVRRILGLTMGGTDNARAKSLVTRIRELGGISRQSWESTYPGERGGEFRIRGVVRGKPKGTEVAGTTGMDWERMAEALRSDGYGPQGAHADISDNSWLVDALADAAAGNPTYREEDYARVTEAPDTSAPETKEERKARQKRERDAAKNDTTPTGHPMRRLGFGPYGILDEQGLDPDVVAQLFEFESGSEMVNAILNATPFFDEVNSRTDERMIAEYSELSTPEGKAAAVNEALHNEARVRSVATTLRHLARSTRPVNTLIASARQVATDIIAGKKVRDVKPHEHDQAEARAARESTKALVAGDDTKAAREKHKELLQGQLAREARAAREEVTAADKLVSAVFGKDDTIIKTRNIEQVLAARAVLAAYDLGKGGKLPREHIGQIEDYDPAVFAALDERFRAAANGDTLQSYKNLTVTEFRDMIAAVQQLWDEAKAVLEFQKNGQAVEMATIRAEMTALLDDPAVAPGETRKITKREKAARHVMGSKASLTQIEHWAIAMDGGKRGPFTKYLFDEVSDRLTDWRIDRNVRIKQLVDLTRALPMDKGDVPSQELDYTFQGTAEIVGLLLQMGSESNKRNMVLGGRGPNRAWGELLPDGTVDTSRVQAFIDRMVAEGKLTKAHFDYAQAVWNLNKAILPQLQKAYRRVEGKPMAKVEATPFTNKFGTYAGGYVPSAIDRTIAGTPGQLRVEDEVREMLPKARSGFTKGRTGATYARKLDVNDMVQHIDDVLLYSHVQPAIKDVTRLLNNGDLRSRLHRVDPTAVDEMLLPWLERAASQKVLTSTSNGNKTMDRLWTALRRNTGIAVMFASPVNTIQQLTGLSNATLYAKPARLASAAKRFFSGDRKTLADSMASLSKFMNDRLKNQVFEMRGEMKEMLTDTSWLTQAQSWSTRHAYFFQSMSQSMVDTITWTAIFDEHMANRPEGMTEQEATEHAVKEADSGVRRSQGSFNPEDVAKYQVGSAFYRTFIQFSGYFNTVLNQILAQPTVTGKIRAGLIGMTIPLILSEIIAKTLYQDWDDDDEEATLLSRSLGLIAKSHISGAAALLPGVGPGALALLGGAAPGSRYGSRGAMSPAVATLARSLRGVVDSIAAALDEDRDVTGRNVRDAFTLTTLIFGVPVSALARPISYWKDVTDEMIPAPSASPGGVLRAVSGSLTGR